MSMLKQWTACAIAALMSAPLVVSGPQMVPALAQDVSAPGRPSHPRVAIETRTKGPPALGKKGAPAPAIPEPQLPPRAPFTAAEDAAAVIPGMPDARFWADSEIDFKNALPPQAGPWLILSSGGADGAFGAGLLNGLSAAGKRPGYALVSGVSTGALMAPFVFAGPRYDDALRDAYTKVRAADIFEAGRTPESFVDSWPLKELIAKRITPEILADIAAEHRRGRRLFVVSTDLDSERFVVWNLGAIAAHGGQDALDLFRSVLLASSAIPGAFPPVLINVEANGKRFAEMHADGGLGGQFFVAPPSLMQSTSDYRLPATELYVVVNTGLERDFTVVDRFVPNILTQSVGAAVKVDTRLMLDRSLVVAKRSGVPFNVAAIPPSFSAPSRGAFDPEYMGALYKVGYDTGRGATPFSSDLPPEPHAPAPPSQIERTGENQ